MQKEQTNEKTIRFIPLSGLDGIGMNMAVLEYGEDAVIIDCGRGFPDDAMSGIGALFPDMSYVMESCKKIRGIVVTHGHEDHIGAIAYFLKKKKVPVYGTKLTIALIMKKLADEELDHENLHIVKYGQTVQLGEIGVEFIRTNHSIRDSAALAFHTPAGVIIHTGDFKVDYTPVNGDPIDLQRFSELGRKGVLALLCDSTNACRGGHTMSEKTVGAIFDDILSKYEGRRLIITTFSSNLDRVEQIVEASMKHGRCVLFKGRSMLDTMKLASAIGYFSWLEGVIVSEKEAETMDPKQLVIIATGSQGESSAALPKMAADLNQRVAIMPNDVVLFSSHPIPGNEKAVSNVINDITEAGATVLYDDAHVSGHACQEDIQLIYALTMPKYAVPVHGERHHLKANAEIAMSMGMSEENIFQLHNGDVLEITGDHAVIVDTVQTGSVPVDGVGNDIKDTILNERQWMAKDGAIFIPIVVGVSRFPVIRTLLRTTVDAKGFVSMRENTDLKNEMRDAVRQIMTDALFANGENPTMEYIKVKRKIMDEIAKIAVQRTKHRPLIEITVFEIEMPKLSMRK